MPAPDLTELAAVAERAVALLDDEGQASVLWERRLDAAGAAVVLRVAITCVVDGRCARIEASGTDDRALARAAKAASLRARQARAWPSGGLPAPVTPPLPHAGFDPELVTIAPERLASLLADGWRAAATRTAIASTRGVRAAEERTFVATARRAPTALGTRRLDRLDAVVLAPVAVAQLLDRLRVAFGVDLALGHGPLAGREGTPVAAEVIELRDDARHPLTLPRAYDAEGMPRRAVVLIERGVLRGGVHDCASAARTGAATTGHATQPATLAPTPDHLVLAGGEAESVEELARPIASGLFLPGLSGPALAVIGGRVTADVAAAAVVVDPIAVLAAAEALTRDQLTVAVRAHTPGGTGASVVPALRTGGGIAPAGGPRREAAVVRVSR